MIKAGTGLAVGAADSAALDASLQAVERSGSDRADLALVFVTGDDALPRTHQALHAVRRVTGARAVLGCSGTGVLTERREAEGESAVAVLAVRCDRLVTTPFLFERQDDRGNLGVEVAEKIGGTVAEGGCVVVLPDARGCSPELLLSQLNDALGFLPLLGAVAAGAPMF